MGYEAKVLADSISPDGVRLVTLSATFPRFILAEVNTHRMLSRCSASSRAIPVEKRIAAIEADPFIPETFGKNQKGMQALSTLEGKESADARFTWHAAKDAAVGWAKELAKLGVHKQLANRLLEPFAWHTAIISATEWSNFFHLRCHPNAQPEFKKIAEMMRDAMMASEPVYHSYGTWHLPLWTNADLVQEIDRPVEDACKISIARCARVSYLTHEGKRDPEEDLKLYERLVSAGHMSPLEHVARPMTRSELDRFARAESTWTGDRRQPTGAYTHFLGNLNGWVQYRKLVIGEEDILDPARVQEAT